MLSEHQLPDHFWASINKNGPIPDYAPHLGRCWLWTGAPNSGGYALVWVGGKRYRAHRLSYEDFHGPIPNGLHIDHLCRVPMCQNPLHLEAVTNRENILRGTNPIAMHARQSHCLRGHPFSEENTLLRPQGNYFGRMCRICARQKARANYRIRKARP